MQALSANPLENPILSGLEGNGQDWIRTSEGVSQRIYSPPRLATSVPTQIDLDSLNERF